MGIGIIEGVKSFFSPSQPEQTGAAVIAEMKRAQSERPEYKLLLRAIRSGHPRQEIDALAVQAAVSQNEVVDLRTLHARATRPENVADAARYESLLAESEEIDAALRDCQKRLNAASTPADDAAIRQEAAAWLRRRNEAAPELARARVCHGVMQAAREAGLL